MRVFKNLWFSHFAAKEAISDDELRGIVNQMEKKYQSEQLMVCHMEAEALCKIDAIDAARMREYDEGCLVPQEKASKKAPKVLETGHPATA